MNTENETTTITQTKKLWLGSHDCDTCGDQCKARGWVFDAVINVGVYRGRWATMCKNCADRYKVQLGIGKGQSYKYDMENGEFYQHGGGA